jgi:hypothetical protein
MFYLLKIQKIFLMAFNVLFQDEHSKFLLLFEALFVTKLQKKINPCFAASANKFDLVKQCMYTVLILQYQKVQSNTLSKVSSYCVSPYTVTI